MRTIQTCIDPALNQRFFGNAAVMAVTHERERFERLAVDEWLDAARFIDWAHAAAVMYAVCRVCEDVEVIGDASTLGQIAHQIDTDKSSTAAA